MKAKIDTFLDQVTTGLAADPELRLDVQAELRSHVADKADELGGEEHAAEAIAAFGEVVELAEEMSEANRRRLGWRGLARRILRFGLVPAAVVCAFVFSDFSMGLVMRQLTIFSDGTAGNATSRPFAWLQRVPKRSENERLVLNGDSTRTGADRYRTLWERHPTNRVYYANYITEILAHQPASDSEKLLTELAHAPTVDPDNGRYPFLAALSRATTAAELLDTKLVEGQGPLKAYTLKLLDRPALDRAMVDLLAAVNMPRHHCYHWDMLQERVDLLGTPLCLLDTIERAAIAAAVLLPDMARARNAARYSLAYAQLLIDGKRSEEAIPFLGISETLGRSAARESFCLIEMLVSSALLEAAQSIVPRTLREIGHAAEAEATERRLAAVGEPMREWREARKRPTHGLDRLLTQRAGVLSAMLLPALGWQDTTGLAEKLENGRRLEFTALTKAIVSLLGFLLLGTMLICLAVTLRWRFALGSQAAPLLLLPSWRAMARFALLGVVVPFVVFLAWTRLMPFSGHAYGPKYAWHRTLAELLALVVTLLLLPAWLAIRSFRQRCAELDLAPPPRVPKALRWLLIVAGILIVAAFLVPLGAGQFVRIGTVLAGAGGVLVALALFCIAILSFFVSRPNGRALGTLSRSLIPVFALATLILSVAAQPILQAQERHLLRADEILWTGDEPGFTRMETELVQRLRKATLKAMAENPLADKPAQEGR